MPTKIAILDDYNRLGLSIGDWASLKDCEITVFQDHLYDTDALIERLKPFDVVCAMRERTAFPRKVFENLPNLKLLNVTVLTSEISDFTSVKVRAELSLEAGAHGLICSGRETAELRQIYGVSPLLVNPGIRPLGGSDDDQIRIVTPTMAIQAGATNIVVGRPITRAGDPRAAAEAIQAEIAAAPAP